MKRKILVVLITLVFNVALIVGISRTNSFLLSKNYVIIIGKDNMKNDENNSSDNEEQTEYDGETYSNVGSKLEKLFIDNKLTGSGEYIAKKSINKGINPYLIGGIILENTNCMLECSIVVSNCNNVGTIKGTPGCFGGTFKKYDTLDDGIDDLIDYIYDEFYSKGKKNPMDFYEKYGKDIRWAYDVGQLMDQIKNTK